MNLKWLLVFVVVVLVVSGIALYVYLTQEHESPELAFDLITPSGKAGEQTTLTLNIANNGNYTEEVIVQLASDAFDQISSDSIEVPSNESVNVNLNANIKDVPNGEYIITITYQCTWMNKFSNGGSETFYVLPSVQIVEEHWPGIGLLEKSHIKRNDETTFYFKVKNDLSSNYKDLTATVTLPSGTSGLTITPPTCNLDPLGPEGKSREYEFDFKSQNAPPGTYHFTVHILSEQHEAYSKQFTIWVEE